MNLKINKHASNDYKIEIIEKLNKFIGDNIDSDIEISVNLARTNQQNKALHKYYSMVSEELNEMGVEFDKLFTKPANLMITPVIIKECMWKTIQKALFGTDSTTKLAKTQQIEKIYDVMNKKLSEMFGIYIPFPKKKDYWEK